MQACMAGIVFAKFTKPSHRGETIMFSKNALISLRNGSLYLMVRLEDRNTNANTNMNANANANASANANANANTNTNTNT